MDFMMLFDRQHMAEGLVCLDSILTHGPESKVFVLCLEPTVQQTLANKERVVSIRLMDLENKYPAIVATKSTRPWAPYTQSLKPFLPEYIFDVYGVKIITYVDSDMLFWGDCGEIDKEMEGHSFMVASRELEPPPPSGYFNGGFFSCRNNRDCHIFLKWWQERCVEWCLWMAGPAGQFGEEGYLNIFKTDPQKFTGIHVSRHPGFNLAPWNVRKHKIERNLEGFMVDGRFPLVCYHYQAFRKETVEFRAHPSISLEISEMLYRPYHDLMLLETKPIF
jgi:hypothetical protein